MKKILIMMTLLALLFSAPAFAQEMMTFTFTQQMVEGLQGWRVYKATTAGGPYEVVPGDIIYSGTPGENYMAEKLLILPVGMNFFVMTSFTDAEESEYSNELSCNNPLPAPVLNSVTFKVQTK